MSDAAEPELNFPCEYPVKVIGKDENQFMDFVIGIISRHVPDLPVESFTARPSSGGKYLSVSVTFIAESRTQIDGLYRELGSHKRVLVAL